jgi:hypothetical protein
MIFKKFGIILGETKPRIKYSNLGMPSSLSIIIFKPTTHFLETAVLTLSGLRTQF